MPTTATTPSELIIAIDTTIRDKTTPNTITPITHSDLLYSMVEVLSATTAPFTGNTSGECISDIYVSNVNSCSPINFRTPEGDSINFYNGDNIKASFTESDGFKLETGVNMTIPDGSGINDSAGVSLLDGRSTTNTYTSDSSTGLATNYWENNLYESFISGTIDGSDTSSFSTVYNLESGERIDTFNQPANAIKTLQKVVDVRGMGSGTSQTTISGETSGGTPTISFRKTHDFERRLILHGILDTDGSQLYESTNDGSQIIDTFYQPSGARVLKRLDDGQPLVGIARAELTTTISGETSGGTPTASFRKKQDCERALDIESMFDSGGLQVYQKTVSASGGAEKCQGDRPACTIAKNCGDPTMWSCNSNCCVATPFAHNSSEGFYSTNDNNDSYKDTLVVDGLSVEEFGVSVIGLTGATGTTVFRTTSNTNTGTEEFNILDIGGSQLYQKSVSASGGGCAGARPACSASSDCGDTTYWSCNDGCCVANGFSSSEGFFSTDGNNDLYKDRVVVDGSLVEELGVGANGLTGATGTTVFRTTSNTNTGEQALEIFDNAGDTIYTKLIGYTTGNGGCPTGIACGGDSDCKFGTRFISSCSGGCCTPSTLPKTEVFGVDSGNIFSTLQGVDGGFYTAQGYDDEITGFATNQMMNFIDGSSSSTIQDYEGHSYTNTSTFSPNDLIISEAYSGSSSGFTGTTSVFKEDHDLINGLLTSKVDGIDSLILSTDGLSSTKVTTPAFKLEDGNQADGYVMTSDADGNASWEAGSVSANDYVVSGEYIDTSSVITTYGGVSVNTSLVSTALLGYDTYQLSVDLDDHSYTNLYSIYGTSGSPMSIPASYQEAAPFGVNTGGVPSAIIAAIPNAAFDGWLTVGITDGDSGGVLGTIGIDFDSWSTDAGLNVTDGAVFWTTPDAGPTGNGIVVAQVSVPTGTIFTASMGLQGRTSGYSDWQESVTFTNEIPVNFKALSLTRLSGDSISIPTPEFTGNTSGNSITDLYVDNLNISTVGSGTPVTNLGVDSSGNVVNGTTGPQTIEVPITSDNITSMFGTPLIVVPAETGFVLEFISAVLVYAFDTQAYIGDGSVKISYTNAFGDVSSDVSRILATSFCFAASSNKIGSLEKHISPEGIELSENYNLAMTTDVNIQNGFPGNAAGIARLHITYNKIPTGY